MWKKYRVAIATKDGQAFEAFTRAHSVKQALDAFASFFGTNVTAISCSALDKEEEQPKDSNPFKPVSGAAITDPMMVLGNAPEAATAPATRKPGRPKRSSVNGQATDKV